MEVSYPVAAVKAIRESKSQCLPSNSNFCLVVVERKPRAGTRQMLEATSGKSKASSLFPPWWDLCTPVSPSRDRHCPSTPDQGKGGGQEGWWPSL